MGNRVDYYEFYLDGWHICKVFANRVMDTIERFREYYKQDGVYRDLSFFAYNNNGERVAEEDIPMIYLG